MLAKYQRFSMVLANIPHWLFHKHSGQPSWSHTPQKRPAGPTTVIFFLHIRQNHVRRIRGDLIAKLLCGPSPALLYFPWTRFSSKTTRGSREPASSCGIYPLLICLLMDLNCWLYSLMVVELFAFKNGGRKYFPSILYNQLRQIFLAISAFMF